MAPSPARFWNRPVVSDAIVARVVQAASFAASPVVLILAIKTAARLGQSPGEILLGVLAGSAAALLLVVLGLVVPMAVVRNESSARTNRAEV